MTSGRLTPAIYASKRIITVEGSNSTMRMKGKNIATIKAIISGHNGEPCSLGSFCTPCSFLEYIDSLMMIVTTHMARKAAM